MTIGRTPSLTSMIVAAVLVALVGLPVGFFAMEHHKSDRRLVHLLCETDYQALLKACRELSQRVAAGDCKPRYVLRSTWGFGPYTPAPETKSLPKAILDVDPVLIQVDDHGVVWVALEVYPDRGVYAYPEDYPDHLDHLGQVELIPSLRFSDENYRSDRQPDFVRYVDRLIDEGKDAERSRREKEIREPNVVTP